MFNKESSIVRQLQRERSFVPPYCPRSTCRHHQMALRANFYSFHGQDSLKRFPYKAQRFRCKDCHKTFSASIFKIYYCQKIWGHNKFICHSHDEGYTKRAAARSIGHDEAMVRRRLTKMAKWSALKHLQFTKNLEIREPVVFDGLENFSFSQYDPNNINQAVGKDSLFIYDFNFCPINRKGRMTIFQKNRKSAIEDKYGHYPRNAIRTSTKRLFQNLLEKTKKLTLLSDEHFQYKRVVEKDLRHKNIVHLQFSSKIHRNYNNPLYAINYIDLEARQKLAAFRRETIAFAKHSIAMQESYVLYMTFRNYRRPRHWKPQKSDPTCHLRSPGMDVGVTNKILEFEEFFGLRVFPTQIRMSDDWRNLYNRVDHLSRRPIAS